jgi:hypothetical protein
VPDLCALWAETTAAPMNIALIGVVEGSPLMGPDGAIALEGIRAFVEARLPRVPLLLRTLRPTRLGATAPGSTHRASTSASISAWLRPAGRSRMRMTSSAGAPGAH